MEPFDSRVSLCLSLCFCLLFESMLFLLFHTAFSGNVVSPARNTSVYSFVNGNYHCLELTMHRTFSIAI